MAGFVPPIKRPGSRGEVAPEGGRRQQASAQPAKRTHVEDAPKARGPGAPPRPLPPPPPAAPPASPPLERPPGGPASPLDPAERQADRLGARIASDLGAGPVGHGPLPAAIRRIAEGHLGVDLGGTTIGAD